MTRDAKKSTSISLRSALENLRLPQFAKSRTSGPVVVALEGPNGVGKTTLCRNLARLLDAPQCLGTDAAWFSESFKVRMIREADWFASAMFFFSGCFEQMRTLGNRPEPLVVMDRSLWSTLAVHASDNVQHLEALLTMLQPIAGEVQVPTLTLTLKASFATCQSRIAKKTGVDRELDQLTASAAFHAREEEFYQWLASQRPEVVPLDAETVDPD